MADVYDQRVTSGSDDGCHASGGWWNVTSTYLWVGNGMSGGFFRFLNLPMGQGVTIDSAYLRIWTHEYSSSNSVNLKVRATAEDSAAAFPSTNGTYTDPKDRTRTSAGVDWTIPDTRNTENVSPDIKSVIQEIVNRPGWSGGGAIALVLEDNGSTYQNDLWAYEYGSSKAARLIITYTGISTYSKTCVSIAKIINPPMDMGIVVSKPGYSAISDTDPTHHIFNSDYGTLKYYASGSVTVYLPADDLAAVNSINHNLGYIPYVEVYAGTEVGGEYEYCPYYGAGATVFYGTTYRVTSTHIYFYAESTGFSGDTNWYFKYFIFKNNLDV